MTRSLLSIAASLALVFASASAAAHVRFVTPTPRHPTPNREDNTIKTAPCGVENDSRTTDESRITVYEPGETITVEFNETIDHPGFFRISFDDDGQDAFQAPLARSEVMATPVLPVLLDDIDDHGPGGYSVEVTLPNVECENCTLQLIQVMSGDQSWTKDDIYYTCADIALRSSGSGAGAGGNGGVGGVAGGGAGGAGAAGMSGTAGAPPEGGAGFGGMTAGTGGVSAGMSGGGNAGTGGVAAAGSSSGGAASGGAASGGAGGASSGGSAGMLGAGGTSGGAAGSAGIAGSGAAGTAATDAPVAEEPGCSCRTGSSGHGARSLSLIAAALAVLALRRRRR